MIVWNDPALTVPLTDAIFPTLAATHQVNRVAALAAAAAEFLAFGPAYMAQIVANAQALAAALHERGVPDAGRAQGLHAHPPGDRRRARQFGGGEAVATRLAEANIITNKNLIPTDTPSRLGPAQRAAHRHDRGHALGDARAGDGAHRRPYRRCGLWATTSSRR